MAKPVESHSAQIIPFPVGGKRDGRWNSTSKDSVAASKIALNTDLAFGGSWYHEAALKEADPVKPTIM